MYLFVFFYFYDKNGLFYIFDNDLFVSFKYEIFIDIENWIFNWYYC